MGAQDQNLDTVRRCIEILLSVILVCLTWRTGLVCVLGKLVGLFSHRIKSLRDRHLLLDCEVSLLPCKFADPSWTSSSRPNNRWWWSRYAALRDRKRANHLQTNARKQDNHTSEVNNLIPSQKRCSLSSFLEVETKTHLTKVPCSMRLDISAGDTSMNRRNEKQLPLSSPKTVKMKTVHKTKPGDMWQELKCVSVLTFSVKKRLLDVICREGRQQHLKNSKGNKVTVSVTVQEKILWFLIW